MPWFVYNYPNDPSQPNNYTLTTGEPTCAGTRLCAIYATTQPNTDPALPTITTDIQTAITKAQSGIITPNVTKLITR